MKLNVVNDELCHHGVKGMHWGVRRYQNPDGTRIKGTRKFNTALDRADRAYKEADKSRKIASKYSTSMDGKVAKLERSVNEKNNYDIVSDMNRQSKNEMNRKAESSTGVAKVVRKGLAANYGINERYYAKQAEKKRVKDSDRLDRARADAKSAKKIADGYVKSMDNKAEKRLEKVDKIYNKQQDKIDKINYKSEIKKANKNSFLDSKRMSDTQLRDATNRMNAERNYRNAVRNEYMDSLNSGQRMVQNTKDRFTQTAVQNSADPIIQETIGKGSRAAGKALAKKAALAAL